MTYDSYMYVFYGGAGLALIFLLVSIILFIVLKIPSVIGNLSGATAKKAIENIRKQNEMGSVHLSESDISHKERASVKDKKNQHEAVAVSRNHDSYSSKFSTTKIGTTEQLSIEAKKSYETSLLENGSMNETTVLDKEEYGETTVLQQSDSDLFSIEYEIMLIHTNEFI